jgi:hypothetical protein
MRPRGRAKKEFVCVRIQWSSSVESLEEEEEEEEEE